MIKITQGLSGKYFSANVPDLEFTISSSVAAVVLSLDGKEIYSESLFPVSGAIALREIGDLLRPYVRESLVSELKVSITEQDSDGRTMATASASCTVVYCEADIDMDAGSWCSTHFLTLLTGTRITAPDRLEYLHYTGDDGDVSAVTATYADGSTKTFGVTKTATSEKFTTIDVSPSRFQADGKRLIAYSVRVGERWQTFEMDPNNPECDPVLVFTNSFGCEELLYCFGAATRSSSFKYDTTYIEGRNINYNITETRSIKADTGPLSFPMAEWTREVFRSYNVRTVDFIDGEPRYGRQVIISDPKVEYSNEADTMPRITFTIQYVQRNHNVISTAHDERVFGKVFDVTFG